MTLEATEQQSQGLFYSPVGLHEFQAEAVVSGYQQWLEDDRPALDVQYDMGLGKTVLSIALACTMIEDGLIDQVVVVAESNKLHDWAREDFPQFAPSLDVALYAGTPVERRAIREANHQVLVMTYETGRNDAAVFKPRSKRAIAAPGPLALALEGKNLLVVMDEVTKLRNRSSKLHIAWDYLINRYLRRKGGKVMAVGLTGTKIETSPADHFNVNLLLAPHRSPTVGAFESTYVKSWDRFGNISDWHNLDPATTPLGITPLSEVYSDITIRKSKTDPDVIDQFPDKVERAPQMVEMTPAQREFYRSIEDVLHAEAEEEGDIGPALTLLRQVSGAPQTLLRSESAFARRVVEVVGPMGLERLGSAKIDAAAAWAKEAADQQMVIYTFFGQSLLPLVRDRLSDEGLKVVVNHGQMSAKDRQAAQNTFKAGDAQVFLSSDAGSRGLNLGVGSALLHLELPLLHSTYEQRSDRIHRINSVHPSVTIDSLVMAGTVETAIMDLVLRRGEWSERVSDGGLRDATSGENANSVRRAVWDASRSLARRR